MTNLCARLIGLFACLFLASPAFASAAQQGQGAACPDGYRITARQSSGQTYDPNDLTRAIIRINLQPAEVDIPQACVSVPVTITPQSGTAFTFTNGGNALGFLQVNSSLVSQANVTRFVLNGNARGQLVRGNTIDIDLFELNAGQFPVAGEYQGALLVQVGNGLPVPVLFSISVRPAIKFVIENGAQTKDLNFGEVSNGATLRTPVFYQSNAAVAITIQSLNQGALVHESGRALGAIPYQLTYDGTPVDLASATLINRPFRSLTTRREELFLSVEPQGNRFAGTYRDVLTLNYTAH